MQKLEEIFSSEHKINQLTESNNELRIDKIKLHLIIQELRKELTKMNKGMHRKNRKIARLRGNK